MTPKRSMWRLWLGVAGVALGIGGVTYASMCPKGFVRFSGFEEAGTFSCIDYGGISTPEHYLNLKSRGRVALFGGPLDGEGEHMFLMRTEGEAGKWICGTAESARFAMRDGEARVERVATILDEAKASRDGVLSLSGLAGGVLGDACESTRVVAEGNVLKVALEVSSSGGGANTERTRVDLTMSGKGITIVTQIDLDEPWPERGDAERQVPYAWVRLTEVIDGAIVRRIAAGGGAESRLVRRGGCATLELERVTPLARCPAEGEADGHLELSW